MKNSKVFFKVITCALCAVILSCGSTQKVEEEVSVQKLISEGKYEQIVKTGK